MRPAALATVTTLAVLAVGVVSAQSEESPRVGYRLLGDSTYQEGCFEPCDCLLLQPQPMAGTFELVYLPTMGPIDTWSVEHVLWSVPSLDREISGSGTFQRIGMEQRLVLDLQIDGNPPQHFDSGFLPPDDPFPAIDVEVTMNHYYCFDIVMHVHARPISAADLALTVALTGVSWDGMADGATYDVVQGDIGLLESTGGNFTGATDLCLADDHVATSVDWPSTPAPGAGAWILVRGTDGIAPGSYDSQAASQVGERDAEIDASGSSCPSP